MYIPFCKLIKSGYQVVTVSPEQAKTLRKKYNLLCDILDMQLAIVHVYWLSLIRPVTGLVLKGMCLHFVLFYFSIRVFPILY